ncbi:hypothetical protein PanWU01x14_246310 [Parasponia andersonii]|uniref:Uncharacterized protein n=1 Tax=Parasponia andersonii TaxID=3476 RepID=A0A2P5BEN1_PARAD|nr:hypothetical protein PanWU01x14_246310 [Parasponia andersonii]
MSKAASCLPKVVDNINDIIIEELQSHRRLNFEGGDKSMSSNTNILPEDKDKVDETTVDGRIMSNNIF